MNLRVIFKYRVAFTMLFIITLLGSCSKEFDLTIPGAEPRLIVEGIITDEKGPYIIRLTKSVNEFGTTKQVIIKRKEYNYNTQKYEFVNDTVERKYIYKGVDNALVIISDSDGVIDTLIQFSFSENKNKINDYDGNYLASYTNYNNEKVSIDIYSPDDYKCYYYTTKVVGKIGNSYTLNIKYNNKEYSATETMLDVPNIDSVTFGKRIAKEGHMVHDKPTLYFKNPPGDDYFLFTMRSPNGFYYNDTVSQIRKFITNSGRVWDFSVKSDKFLSEYVKGLRLPAGVSDVESYQNGFYPLFPGQKYTITMESISQHTYNYMSSLSRQFHSLGGVFHPTPSDPPGNISNGALGFFRVSAVSKSKGTMPSNAWN